ncbi:glycosyl hydrolase [Nocardiopsis lambiniae]|uniref:glucan endo-1,3-beta-D-glucosidase n=1 Tax=Nocardiopsis lambiniae TaxID=3075539 RepID=A0ABU2MDQ8_9ACTN|nr:glycosyl hydrolase [Nocardiopsis sp. DSM 44743]MDT0330818.1 glycosyl hydrolase [Nocardiopsis sp. DSM 44743]
MTVGAGADAEPAAAATALVPVGSGSYDDALPPGATGPADLNGTPVSPKVTDDFEGPAPTNEWWSSLIFQRYPDNPYGENLYAHPATYRPHSEGLEMGHPSEPRIVADGLKYEFPHTADLSLGAVGLDSPDTRVADSGDWTVTARWEGGAVLDVTIGQGLPFAHARTDGGDAEVSFTAAPQVWHEDGATVGVTVNGNHYALFAPTGDAWSRSGNTFTAPTGGGGHYSVALLPSPEALADFAPYAHSAVTGSVVEYDYDEAGATLTSTYRVETEALEGDTEGTVLAMYPHHWDNSDDEVPDLAYPSPRGEMRVALGTSFTTELTAHGILPSLPTVDSADHDRLRLLLDEVLAEEEHFPSPGDTYWDGKAMGRLAQLVPIADSIGHTEARDELLGLLKGRVQEWLTAGGDRGLHYEAGWGTLLGYPDSFGATTELNDHDFHYGYLVTAAATIARYDRDWADEDAWGGMVRMVIDDVAATEDGAFPRLRSFSPYAGHGWASGHAGFAAGNNQESSSEGMHFASATALFGALTGDEELRDLGVFLHTTQASTVTRYWQDHGGETFPDGFDHDVVGMVWGDGGDYRIWWDGGDEEHYGINYLPITAGSLYLGHDPEHAGAMYTSLVDRLGREPEIWRDIHWAHRALSDGDDALGMFEAQWQNYEPEAGGSKPHTYQWVSTLAEVGTVDASVTADTAHYAVFSDGDGRAYTAFNPGASPITVTFSDGTELEVAPGTLASTVGEGGGGDPGDPGDPDPSPSPDPGEGDLGDGVLHAGSGGLSAAPPGTEGLITVPDAGGVNRDGTPPADAVVLELEGVSGTFTGGTTAFSLPVDSGGSVANAVQVRVEYDFDGDGTADRVETHRYFATDDVPGWETYTQAPGPVTGDFADLDGGTVRLRIWSALGSADSVVRTGPEGGATLTVPFTG